jgi:type IV secretion system protein VirD4
MNAYDILFIALLAAGGLWAVTRGWLGALACRAVLVSALAITAFGIGVLGLKMPWVGWIVLGFGVWQLRRSWRGGQYAHGTARFANFQDLCANGLVGTNDGLILGRANCNGPPSRWQAIRILLRFPLRQSTLAIRLFVAAFGGPRWSRRCLIRLSKYVHLSVFASTGRGKGTAFLVPNLLSHRGSCVVTDPKGELHKLTAGHRRKKFRHRIVRIDPFGLGGPGADTFNPLDLINANAPDVLDQCRDLANAMVVRSGQEHEPHWNDSAELILTAFIAFVVVCETAPEHRNLQTVRDLVSSRDKFLKSVAAIQQSPALRRLGNLMTWYQDKELASIMSTVQRHTAFLDSGPVAACTLRSSFHPRHLRTGRTTLYLILPQERLVSLAPLMRMWIASTLRELSRGTASERNPVLFLIDEAAHLGHIQALEDAVTLMRGYGIRLWFFWQSLGQLTKCFGDRAPVFLDNIDTQIYFGINGYESAEAVSKRLGDATITSESYNRTTGQSQSYGGKGQDGGNTSTGTSVTLSEMGRRLLKPEEIMCLPADQAVIFHRNLPPIYAGLAHYFNAPEFRHGRTGEQRGLGLAAGLMALVTMLISSGFAAFALFLPAPEPAPRHVGRASDGGRWNAAPPRGNPSHYSGRPPRRGF